MTDADYQKLLQTYDRLTDRPRTPAEQEQWQRIAHIITGPCRQP